MPRGKMARKIDKWSLLRVIGGAALTVTGAILWTIYFRDSGNMLAGAAGAGCLVPGITLLIWAWRTRATMSQTFVTTPGGSPGSSRTKANGDANAVIIQARRSDETDKDVPVRLIFANVKHIPKNAQLHFIRNYGKHYYELYNDTTAETAPWKPVEIPDKTPFPPKIYNIFSTMQSYKEALEYVPMNTLQKFAPWILILAMVIVGILMVMTVTG